MKKIEKQLASESFINFVHRRNAEDVVKWEKWIQANPQHEELIERAILVISSLQFNTNENPEAELRQWHQLQDRIRKEAYKKRRTPTPSKTLTYGLAAVFAGTLVSIVLWFQFWHNPMITFETGIAQKAALTLPDGSEIVLNKNSSIRFQKSWDKDSVRQVRLEGEAHFKVKPNKRGDDGHQRFEVHTDDLVIDVVGTVFNVNTEGDTYVALESGRVDIRQKGKNDTYTLQPGQSVTINPVGDLIMSEMNVKPHISWVDNKIILNDNTLAEIIQFIEGSYGLTIHCDDESLLKRQLSGQIRLDNIDDLFHVLEKVLDLVIVRDNDTVKMVELKKHNIHV